MVCFSEEMTALKSLLDAECGTTNPFVQLSQIYTHIPQVIPTFLVFNRQAKISFLLEWFK